jgi:AraC-like DNA-binding protein
MKSFVESIPLASNNSYIVREFHSPRMAYPFHQHPQYEISYVVKGEGTRIVGDHISRFSSGDLVMVGPDLPHRWLSENEGAEGIHNIIVQIDAPFLGEGFLEKEEMLPLRELFELTNRGIQFQGKTAEKLAGLINELIPVRGFDGIMKLLEIILIMSQSKEFVLLSGMGFSKSNSRRGADTINVVTNYLLENYQSAVSLENAAAIAKMNKSAFAHFFKRQTNLNFSVFVNELRISHSVALLLQTQFSISEICYKSGFSNLSYFNRVFQQKYGLSPRQYRARWKLNNF